MSMLTISKEQQENLAGSLQERFLVFLADHLHDEHRALCPESIIDYRAPESMARLRREIRMLLDTGIETEIDVATAIEYFELFEVNFHDQCVVDVLTQERMTVYEKLDLLWALRKK